MRGAMKMAKDLRSGMLVLTTNGNGETVIREVESVHIFRTTKTRIIYKSGDPDVVSQDLTVMTIQERRVVPRSQEQMSCGQGCCEGNHDVHEQTAQ